MPNREATEITPAYQQELLGKSVVWIYQPFMPPFERKGYVERFGLASIGKNNLILNACAGVKEIREDNTTGDNLAIFVIQTPKGTLLLTDIEDGFTTDKERWEQIRKTYDQTKLPKCADEFFTYTNYQFAGTKEWKRWVESTLKYIENFPAQIHEITSGHMSFELEGALKYIIRDYLNQKNTYRQDRLRGFIDETQEGQELVNGIFGVTALWIPKEVEKIDEACQIGVGGTPAGVAICRSLADTVLGVSWPAERVFISDANAYVDYLFKRARTFMPKENFERFKELLYEKVNVIYAAFGNQQEVAFALAQEEQLSGTVDRKLLKAKISGSTDGTIFTDSRDHIGDMEALFLSALAAVEHDPKSVAEAIVNPPDDFLAHNIGIEE